MKYLALSAGGTRLAVASDEVKLVLFYFCDLSLLVLGSTMIGMVKLIDEWVVDDYCM